MKIFFIFSELSEVCEAVEPSKQRDIYTVIFEVISQITSNFSTAVQQTEEMILIFLWSKSLLFHNNYFIFLNHIMKMYENQLFFALFSCIN